ncbi:platelet glycoprotein Ib alpha chain [Triplophysa dalaica]|uniref:platelet glycoprotein Ib alpha chain n=1 Tax=Triplophysa dalaica TaxID=1582913 RepID=UPI0024E02AD9|nr:platelet glycoprotein Ib alpha chain [Triplophysa dalaica]
MRAIVSTLLFLTMRSCNVAGSVCRDDRDKDHRSRVSCVNHGLTALPGGIKPLTQVLVLTGNRFTSLSWSDYSAFTHLYELDLSHNDITALEPPGPVLENLSVLRLSGNRLTGLGGRVFRCAPSLMEIYLSGNRIRYLHDDTFSDLQRLEVINLSGNNLFALPVRLLERVSSGGLKMFDLENNSVSLMPYGFFSSKPELPYVYLSYNPWLCSCSVEYLHSYLNDQEHNVYKQEGPKGIVPGADSVLCAGPPHLRGRPIIDLKEDDFCPPEPTLTFPLYPGDELVLGEFDKSDVMRLADAWTHRQKESESKYLFSSEVTPTDPVHSMSDSTSSEHLFSSEVTPTHPSPLTSSEHLFSSEVTPTDSSPLTSSEHFTEESTADTTLKTQSTVWNITPPQTTTLTPDRPTSLKTTAPTTAPSGHQTSTQTSTESTSVQPEATSTGVRMLPWCWWLFAGFVLLCLLSGLTCCILFLWLLRNYLLLYRRLQCYAPRCLEGDGVTLRAFRRAERTEPRVEEVEDMVTFLNPEQIKDTRAVFRSVLFISKEEHESLRDVQTAANGRDMSITAAERARAVTFRKTLYRVISEEHTHNRWTEEEERWDQNAERSRATRYSLILKENTGRETNVEWLMGEWEMGERGVVYERDPAL